MNDTTWRELCEAIMKEQDPNKLLNLVDDLNGNWSGARRNQGIECAVP